MVLQGRTFSFLLAALLLSSPLPASAGKCADFLSATKNYFREVRDTKGLRLLVAPVRGSEPPERYYGFVSPRGWPAPFSGVYNVTIDKPVNAAVRALAGPGKKGTFLAKLPAIVGAALLTQVYVIDPAMNWAMDNKIQSEITENKSAFDKLIQTDYRFASIRERLASGEILQEDADREAYVVARSYQSYYEYRDARHGVFTDEENERLLDQLLFAHLKPALTDGVVAVPEGFVKLPDYTGRVSLEHKRELFKITHALYLHYQIVDAFFKNASDPALQTAFTRLREDGFTQKVLALQTAGNIDAAQAQRALQEHAYWEYRLRAYALVGVQKLYPDTERPVSMEDYDAAILADLQ